jgi:predicted PurR-regulated permease PerM
MTVLGMPNPVLWGVMAGGLNFVPYLGGMVSMSIFAIVAFLTFDTWTRIILPPLCFLFLTGLEGQVITPMIMGSKLVLNPIAIFVFMFFSGWVWGVLGILISVPMLATIKIIAGRTNLRLLSRLIG